MPGGHVIGFTQLKQEATSLRLKEKKMCRKSYGDRRSWLQSWACSLASLTFDPPELFRFVSGKEVEEGICFAED